MAVLTSVTKFARSTVEKREAYTSVTRFDHVHRGSGDVRILTLALAAEPCPLGRLTLLFLDITLHS